MTDAPKAAPMCEDVTQADRDALADLLGGRQLHPQWVSTIRSGGWDKTPDMRVIVRHRLAHTARPDAGDEVKRALDPWRRVWAVSFAPFDKGLGQGISNGISTHSDEDGAGPLLPKAWPTIGDLRKLAAMREGAHQAMVEQLRKALEPFAAVADEWDRWQAKGSTSTPSMLQLSYGKATIGLPEYQAARTAIISISQNDAIAERGAA